jgi:uncharacterized NAD(P)/FAD-binding protein YdhS
LAKAFLPRRLYGDYPRAAGRGARRSSRLDVLRDTAVTIDRRPTAGGSHWPPVRRWRPMPWWSPWATLRVRCPRGAPDLPAGRVVAAWDHDAVHGIGTDEAVAIVGSGLSMVDSVLSLESGGHRGPVHVLSRHALRRRCAHPARLADVDVDALAALPCAAAWPSCAGRRGRRRKRPAVAGGDGSDPALRPAPVADPVAERPAPLPAPCRAPLGRSPARIAAPVDAVVTCLRETGRLTSHRVRLRQAAMLADGRIRLESSAPDGRLLQLDVDRIVNATGVEMRVQFMGNPARRPARQGLAVPGRMRSAWPAPPTTRAR